jgi:NADPH-dependent 2,4-dienoyl-CoA reductase/sulfur reductase-like enzyme
MSDILDLLIVGAGPAGLSAARIASSQGLSVTVVDEQPRFGGQVFRQAPEEFAAADPDSMHTYPFSHRLFEWARGTTAVQWHFSTLVWGIFDDPQDEHVRQIGTAGLQGASVLKARRVLIATGAYDLPVAFPGWTLPGVLSAGGVQTMIKSQSLMPGQRFLLVGGHPLLLLVAELLLDAGAQIAEVAIARSLPSMKEMLRATRALPGQSRLVKQLLAILLKLRRHGVPLRFATGIERAHGDESVQAATLCNVDQNWHAMAGTQRRVEADTVVVGYGLLASTELARQAGCAVRWDSAAGGWLVQHDDRLRSTQSGVLVAGEQTGIAGAFNAHLQGELAAWQCVLELQQPAAVTKIEKTIADLQLRLGRNRRFTDTVIALSAPKLEALAQAITPDTVVCRCEEVTAQEVNQFLDAHPYVADINSIKLACRTGMGMCQGRYCQHTVAQMLASRLGRGIDQVGIYKAQAPVKPVPVAVLANMK